jgi:hypothetical protein
MKSGVVGMQLRTLAGSLFLILATSLFLFGQSGTTGISGIVTDTAGAAVPGATITLSDPSTGFSRTTTTNSDGKYNFPGLQPATYRLEVTSANFKKLVNSNVKALVDTPIEVNLVLQAGDVTAIVDVTSDNIESVINTQDASLGNNFEPRQITQLPTDLRRVADLLTLQPGVTREGYVAGGRSDQANVLLDGVDINDQQTGGRDVQFQTTQDTVLRSTAESVEEFRITTTNGNADVGRSSGAQISLVTKSGTNGFHGSAYYFYRPTAFSANTFFNNRDGVERPSLARHVYGGSFGGPIKKDKLFFFYAYEGQNEKLGVSSCSVVPLASLGQGTMKFTGWLPGEDPKLIDPHPITISAAEFNQIFNIAHENPVAVAVLANAASKYVSNAKTCGGDPAAAFINGGGDGVNIGGFRFNSSTAIKETTHIARFDWNINSHQRLFGRLNKQNDTATGPGAFPDTPQTSAWIHPEGFVIGHDWTIGANKVNTFRYGITRQAFSTQGDSSLNSISFRFVYSPSLFLRTLSRVTPTNNFSDDFIWTMGNHTLKFGGNIRTVRNERVDFANAFDSAITNPSFYSDSGRVLDQAFEDAGYTIAGGQSSLVQNAATALLGRYSEYSGNFTFDINGKVIPSGSPTERTFATEEYEGYVQDQWKPFHNLTLTYGIRYSLDRPVYEKNGFEVVPIEPLGDFFDRRVASAARGVPLNDLIEFQKGGPANNAPGFYKMDWKNWQPSVAAAWSPDFKHGLLRTIFGGNDESVIRGGFRKLSDHFGEQLAVSFDGLSSIGFTSSTTIAANTYNVTDNLAPLFTGFNQDVRALPGIPAPVQRFSTEVDPDCLAGFIQCPERIENSLDATIQTPTHYVWNVSWGRRLPKGLYVEASYVGRLARHLLAARDVNALNDLVDPGSGVDWYTAARTLASFRAANTPINSVPKIPFFEHFFPGIGDAFGTGATTSTQAIYSLISHDGFNIQDYTFVQDIIDDIGIVPNLFFHPQYAAFSSFSSVAHSNYNGAILSVRQRLGTSVTWDFNYTFSKSLDNASGLQTGTSYGSQFILNALRPEDNYARSDFDTQHVINANFILELPFGKGRHWFSDMNKYADTVLGGWQITGILRWNSGLPLSAPSDAAQWATNWNVQSAGTVIKPVNFHIDRNTQSVFPDPQAALNAFRNALPGETGQRNVFRGPSYSTLDMGLSKEFSMPWHEGHKLAFRWEVFNVMNKQYFNPDSFTRESYGLPEDSDLPDTVVAPGFGQIFSSIQGNPRRMQFGLRYSF